MKLQPFAIHEQALALRAQRNEVLASNIANADTPHYKARDLDFAAALKDAQGATLPLARTSSGHVASLASSGPGAMLKYRIPTQPALDGNTVETDVEQGKFAENAVQYRATLTFLSGSINALRYAIKGGD